MLLFFKVCVYVRARVCFLRCVYLVSNLQAACPNNSTEHAVASKTQVYLWQSLGTRTLTAGTVLWPAAGDWNLPLLPCRSPQSMAASGWFTVCRHRLFFFRSVCRPGEISRALENVY